MFVQLLRFTAVFPLRTPVPYCLWTHKPVSSSRYRKCPLFDSAPKHGKKFGVFYRLSGWMSSPCRALSSGVVLRIRRQKSIRSSQKNSLCFHATKTSGRGENPPRSRPVHSSILRSLFKALSLFSGGTAQRCPPLPRRAAFV